MPATTSTPRKTPSDHKPKAKAATPKAADRTPSEYGGDWSVDSFDFIVPTGAKVLLRKVTVQGLLEKGILSQADQLTANVVGVTIPKAQGLPPKMDTKMLLNDPEKMHTAFEMVDRIVKYVVLLPELQDAPTEIDDKTGLPKRDSRKFYIDLIDINDKAAIMDTAIGGSAAMSTFLQGPEGALGGISAVEDNGEPTE